VEEKYPSENVEFLEENRLEHFQIPICAHKDESVVIPSERIAAALRVLLDSRNHPILIHCNKGKVWPSSIPALSAQHSD
jgi:tyrosine-protein phosphatase SIW14